MAETARKPVPAVRLVAPLSPAEEERRRTQVFRTWLSQCPTSYLECRNGQHVKPGITDKDTEVEVDRKQGLIFIQEPCPRCGTIISKTLGLADGYLQFEQRGGYVHPDGYLVPKGARDGHVMGKERRGEVRLELVNRKLAISGKAKLPARKPRRQT